ncbi:hypothetical protein Tel_14885 [Candidatus Tenderia electrophaga]|jgi:hypothetical protein|uniref:LysM domain-containing protein n=1 Tax=Candidatus Tenderia electrophaga TaxID=1748243 RepID=A0A0S2TGP5_9GAMM|nr:hypothetical protein Tel_14885 [Candidatus Tenderia electrophaga]
MSIRNALLALIASLCLNTAVFADTLALNPDHPQRYVVVKGDTLWDISSKFLRDPWRWPEIWHINPEIKNPHLIYPGDVISLVFRDGKPVLELTRGRPTIKLSPTARTSRLESAITTIPSSAVAQFLKRPRILTQAEINQAGYISYAEEDHLISGEGGKIYVADLQQDDSKDYSIYRIGNVYRNPDDKNDILGYEAIHVSDARLIREGEPATLRIVESYRETLLGDKVMASDEEAIDNSFTPHAPGNLSNGRIISIFDGMSRAGQYQTVVLNLGKMDGMELGHVLAVRKKGIKVTDEQSEDFFKPQVQLPDERSGLLMVVNVFDRVSYALVMSAVKDIRIGDPVTKP